MLLTIGIPTYNRQVFLKENLDALFPQLSNYLDDVEVLIADNASDDDTQRVVEEASKKHNIPVRYRRQETNVGPENNAVWVANNAIGKYLFLMGDDDILSPNFVDIIVPVLKSEEDYVAVHWNRLSGNAECTDNIIVDEVFNGKTVELLTPKGFVLRVMEKPNFISSIIFRKDVLSLGSSYNQDKYYGYSFFAQMYFGIVLSNSNCLYYYMPLVIQRNPSKTWMKLWPQYCISSMSNIFFDLDEKVPGIYEKWRKKLDREIKDILPEIMRDKRYYRMPEVRHQLEKHMSSVNKFKMTYYLYMPFSLFFHKAKTKALSAVIDLLERWK